MFMQPFVSICRDRVHWVRAPVHAVCLVCAWFVYECIVCLQEALTYIMKMRVQRMQCSTEWSAVQKTKTVRVLCERALRVCCAFVRAAL